MADGTTTGPAGGRAARLAVLAAAVLWGTTGTAQALGPAGTTSATVGALRITAGASILVAAAAGTSLRASRRPRGGDPLARSSNPAAVALAAAVAAAGVAAYQVCFFAAVQRAGVAVGTVVGIGSAPAITGTLGWLVTRERPERGWGPATALAVAGCALLLAPGVGAGRRVAASGVALALGAGGAYAAYTLASKRLLDAGWSPAVTMAAAFGGGAVLLAPVLAGADLRWLSEPRGVAMVAWLGVATTGLAYLLYARGLARLPAATVATISLGEPLTAALLGVGLLGERPGATAAAGALLVAAGLLWLLRR